MKPILEALAIIMSSRPLSMYDRFTLQYNGEQVLHKPLHKGDLLKPFVERAFLNLMKYIMKSLSIWVNSTVLLGVSHNILKSKPDIKNTGILSG